MHLIYQPIRRCWRDEGVVRQAARYQFTGDVNHHGVAVGVAGRARPRIDAQQAALAGVVAVAAAVVDDEEVFVPGLDTGDFGVPDAPGLGREQVLVLAPVAERTHDRDARRVGSPHAKPAAG